MNVSTSSSFELLLKRGRSRKLGIVLFVLVLLVGSSVVEFFTLRYHEENWEHIVDEKCAQYLQRVEQDFVSVQRVTRRIATEVAQHPVILANLTNPTLNQPTLIEYISKVSRDQQVGTEVYDRQGKLIVWEGLSGPAHHREVLIALAGRMTSNVTRSSVYSQLFVSTPVRSNGRIIGVVLIRRTIEVNYPLNNKFIKREGFADQLSQNLGVAVELNFSENAEPKKDGRFLSATLYGIDSTKIGVASVSRPARSAYLESISALFDRFNAVVFTLLVILFVASGARGVLQIQSVLLRSLGVTLVIWTARYIFLWIDMPSLFFSSGIFDPANFASKFGWGLAKSIGELTLTDFALLVNVLVVTKAMLDNLHGRSPWWHPRNIIVRFVLAIIAATLVFLLLRGFGATVRSAVFDSTLSYGDPRVIVPSFELGLMVVNLFIISFCLIVVVVGLTSFIKSLISPGVKRENIPWVVTFGLLALAAILFGVFQENPLMSTWYRLLFVGGVVGLTYHVHRRGRLNLNIASPGIFLLALGLSAAFFYPLLDEKVHEKDRSRVEVFAGEFLRPVDSWLSLVVEEALQAFTTDETTDILTSGDADVVRRLAFTRWAQSSICREGYSCVFAVYDSASNETSRFMLGGQSILLPQLEASPAHLGEKGIQVTEIGSGINAVKVYRGTIPISSADGNVIAHAVVVITAGQQTLFRGETPTLLRNISKESLESFYRPVAASEFHDGALFASNNSSLPLGYELPEKVRNLFKDSTMVSLWNEEVIDENRYETYYVRRTSRSDAIVGLSVQELGVTWHLVSAVKVLVYYAIVVLAVLFGFFLYEWLGRRRYEFKFRDKLLIALLVTAIVPMIMIGTIGRMFARERLMESAAHRLEQETGTVGLSIIQQMEQGAQDAKTSLSPQIAEQIASDFGTDFNVYIGKELEVSSRPELYEAGILDRRMSGSAYANIIVERKRFFLQTETLGLYRYAVGYRPLVASSGNIIGVVSVPTLFRQDELDEEVSKQNALIFGVYAFVLFAILIIATTLANRIAAPIHKLTEATKRVSKGDLDVNLSSTTTDGEIGELIHAFESMTKDLKRSREELIKVEREVAWKEMAKQVAHEIKNPLTPMKLSLQHLRQTYKDKVPDLDRVFDEVSRTLIDQIDTLGRIASEFSHFARMPKPRFEECDVNVILVESTRLFEQEANIRFEMNPAGDLPPVMADREELRRAFINIIRNGIQAMASGGKLVITTVKEKSEVVVSIRDFGSGIPTEFKERLFQPNFSTKTDGMGLGLAIVKKTVDDLNGTIEIESETGKGTTVTIRIPVSNETAVA